MFICKNFDEVGSMTDSDKLMSWDHKKMEEFFGVFKRGQSALGLGTRQNRPLAKLGIFPSSKV